MSWSYPRYRAVAADVVDCEDLSDTVRAFAIEIDGMLGEMDVTEGAITSWDDMAGDSIYRLFQDSQVVNWTILIAGGVYGGGVTVRGNEPVAGPAGSFRIPNDGAWYTITDMTATVRCRGGDYEVMASWQQDAGATSGTANYWTDLVGVQYAISVDGTIREETTMGGVDRSNDSTGEAVATPIGPYAYDVVLHLTPGRHTISVVARTARNADYNPISSNLYVEVFNREFDIWEAH